ncbi:hypothetical protein FPOAC2_13193 [Fusarium poae]
MVCQQTAPRIPRSPPGNISRLSPWELVGMDYLGPINPPSAEGHRYILLIADYMTKFIGGACHHSADGTEVLNTWEANWGATALLHELLAWSRGLVAGGNQQISHLCGNPACLEADHVCLETTD